MYILSIYNRTESGIVSAMSTVRPPRTGGPWSGSGPCVRCGVVLGADSISDIPTCEEK